MSYCRVGLPLRGMGTFLARYVMTRLVDDIDGSHAVTTVSFSHCVARLAKSSWDCMIFLNIGFSAAFFLTTSS